ncbi:uncharacterized protein EV154DRAFT_571280 [Mucor mucedo]|uniref:uncharacterized protein n=1 Tax=Mucor mucedo TaxID=29922 RepID=UPI00221FE7ED|nr:uncharacterized protein EV154DRAFT_571280 [Mucor mucedo]KAI7868975.1 hypothetical protein EV154DRAFT_571280 [Mucor mucedo]
MNNQNNNNNPINHQFIEEVPVVVPTAAAVSPAAPATATTDATDAAATIKFRIPDTRAQNGIQLAPLLLLNCMLSTTSGWSPISKWYALCAAFRDRYDRLNPTGTARIENWVYHDAMENPTSEVPTVTPTTVYASLAGETIDNRGKVAVLDKAVDQTIEHLVTSMNEIEARCFDHVEPSIEKRDQVQSRIAEQMQGSLDIQRQMLMVLRRGFGSRNKNATSYNAFENGG